MSNSCSVANGLADGQGLGKNMIGVIWGGSTCINLSKWGKGVKTLVSLGHAHQKVTSAVKKFNNQVGS